jgi:nucleoside-diphosphate-sugar epimerase
MKVLITGANGFIGLHLMNNIALQYNVIAQTRENSLPDFANSATLRLNIDATTDWSTVLENVSVVVHLAGVAHNKSSDTSYMHEINVDATLNLALQAANSGVKRFIFISSSSVFGDSSSSPFNEFSVLSPCSFSATLKKEVEEKLSDIYLCGMELVIIRPALVYGVSAPGNFGKLVSVVSRIPFSPFWLCDNKRSFISIDNLVDFIGLCISHPKAANEIFCISDGLDISTRQFTNEIAVGLDKKLIQFPIPLSVLRFLGVITGRSALIDQLIGDFQIDSNKARKLLGWVPPSTITQTMRKLRR